MSLKTATETTSIRCKDYGALLKAGEFYHDGFDRHTVPSDCVKVLRERIERIEAILPEIERARSRDGTEL